jgi:hypothetical protein
MYTSTRLLYISSTDVLSLNTSKTYLIFFESMYPFLQFIAMVLLIVIEHCKGILEQIVMLVLVAHTLVEDVAEVREGHCRLIIGEVLKLSDRDVRRGLLGGWLVR